MTYQDNLERPVTQKYDGRGLPWHKTEAPAGAPPGGPTSIVKEVPVTGRWCKKVTVCKLGSGSRPRVSAHPLRRAVTLIHGHGGGSGGRGGGATRRRCRLGRGLPVGSESAEWELPQALAHPPHPIVVESSPGMPVGRAASGAQRLRRIPTRRRRPTDTVHDSNFEPESLKHRGTVTLRVARPSLSSRSARRPDGEMGRTE